MAALFGTGTAAHASPTSFVAKAVHSGGAGATALIVTGGLSWSNRSVTLTNVQVWVAPHECGYVTATGFQGDRMIDDEERPTGSDLYCGYSSAHGLTYGIGNIPLDGSAVSGGITLVWVGALDSTHGATGYADCYRAKSACTQTTG
ncbi:hypothetical protein [Fodinicola acaciae]|uniref:hypothetical protein n=1 Tax=Fodinicola acaciae TaxID=2681555 RepID=UPI0013D6E906|nr:hypothetical protein [Fodinicola acaciae]